jgi:hypothetical protein
MNCSDFTYRKSFPIPYSGCAFDSLLELKFALSIENDYRFLRSPEKIETTRVYTPDFLIRHKLTHEAWLIELKPTAYKISKNVSIYNSIATDDIKKQSLDWSFNVIFGSEIHIEPDKLNKFRMFAMRKTTFQTMFDFQKMDQKYNHRPVKIFSSVPAFNGEGMTRAEYSHWVRRGI